jgi:Cu-Zn family superoxide dismutase
MKAIPLLLAAAAGAALVGCAADQQAPGASATAAAASAEIRNAAGAVVARATASETAGGIRLRVEALAMAPGAYGAHVHTIGRCDPPDFATAGPHWNPAARKHGKNNPEGMHMGDLPNLAVGADGHGSFQVTIPNGRLGGGGTPLLDADGAAVVIHASADDYRTDPSGNSGARIACGVLG